ncbi:hypothetical protein OQA88_651 [Cercophora sp. LCS_1]
MTSTDTSFWDKSAQKYSQSPIADQAGYERTLAATRAHLRPTDTVTELGCGTGGTAISLGRSVKYYLATDISPGMISIANTTQSNTADAPSGLEFRVATADSLAAEQPGKFNAVLAFNYLHLVRDLAGTLKSVNTLLAPGGLFISKTGCVRDMRFGMLLGPALPVLRVVGLAPFVNNFDAGELKAEFQKAGFEIVAEEYHGSGKGDARPFIVAKKVA